MKTIGEILKTARQEKGISLEDISHTTRISLVYLEAIEKNDFKTLPAAAFTKGFIQNFARTVGVKPKNALAIFRRDYDQDERGRIVPRGLEKPVRRPLDVFTPATTTLVLSIVIGIVITVFFVRQLFTFVSAPEISVHQPQENQTVTSPITVSGTTDPQATVTLNNRLVNVDPQGKFETQITLPEGEHVLVVTATSRGDKSATVQRAVIVSPPQP